MHVKHLILIRPILLILRKIQLRKTLAISPPIFNILNCLLFRTKVTLLVSAADFVQEFLVSNIWLNIIHLLIELFLGDIRYNKMGDNLLCIVNWGIA